MTTRRHFATTLQTRTGGQAARLEDDREKVAYLPEVTLAEKLRIDAISAGLPRADYVFLGGHRAGDQLHTSERLAARRRWGHDRPVRPHLRRAALNEWLRSERGTGMRSKVQLRGLTL